VAIAAAATGRHVIHVPARSDESSSDPVLLQAVRAGDKAAFGALVQRYVTRASALALRVVHDPQDAQDVVQDAFLSALHRIDTFDMTRPFWPWLSRIVVHRGIDVIKARGRSAASELDATIVDGARGPFEALHDREIRERMVHALAQLSPQRRLIIEMFEIDGYTVAEICAELDMASPTVRWHLHVGRKSLRASLAMFKAT
jgi:RNA polymerase sigma-70 factor (ECF subfamily)